MKRLVSAAIVSFVFAAVLNAQHPNEARGFAADHVYSVHDVDTISAFNGNMMIHIPIGPEYKVNGALSYRLVLTYNSHCWRFVYDPPPCCSEAAVGSTVAFPTGSDNAGLGWRLSLGKLYQFGDPDITSDVLGGWVYQTSDGADHKFYTALNSGLTPSSEPTQYTRDGSYIRLSTVNDSKLVELPDGTVYRFKQRLRVSSGAWPLSTTSHEWFLDAIMDSFGNIVTIAYSSSATYREIWTITDVARTTTVSFKAGLTSDFAATLDHVDIQAVGGSALSYSFATQLMNVPPGNGDNSGRATLAVPVLTAITPSLGRGYSMMVGTSPAYDTSALTSGVLTRLLLPTLGSVGWAYRELPFGPRTRPTPRSPSVERPSAVASRTTYDTSGTALGTWTYDIKFGLTASCPTTCYARDGSSYPCSSGRARQLTAFVTEPATADSTSARKTTISYFSNYENVDDPGGDSCATTPEGWVHSEHGLPFTRYAAKDGRFLSTEVRTGVDVPSLLTSWNGRGKATASGPADGTTWSESYVTYRLDGDAADDTVYFDHNASLSSTATYYNDFACGDDHTVQCYTAANYLGFDGYGHYRQTSTDGNFPGSANFRTAFTNFNASPTTSSWLLNVSSERCTVDEAARRSAALSSCNALPGALISKTQYDSHGALTARRTLLNSGGTLDAADLLTTFEYDAAGNLVAQRDYGGDTQTLGTTAPFSAPADPTYAVTHALTYTDGALTRDIATYANGVTASDETYDKATGLVTDTRDVSDLVTHYDYDVLGRVTGVQPPGMKPTAYTYSDAAAGSTFTPAKVSAVTDASADGLGKISKEYQYDAFGRLWREKSLLPSDAWSIIQTTFDVLGRKTAVSQPEVLTGTEAGFSPAHATTYTAFDAFGRAGAVQTPDGNITTVAFAGMRRILRTADVATSSTGTSAAPVEEIRDALGRLYQVTERSGSTSATTPVGTDTTTIYTYDSGDHLTSVATSSQHRYFTYDHRGFLTQEQHPEVGQNGNASISYVYTSPAGKVGYDARGHAGGKLIGTINGLLDLRFTYDSAERLTAVSDSGDSKRLVKQYSFLAANGGASPYGKGKINQAIRYNHLPSLTADVLVTETYRYAYPSGRPSGRDTVVENVNGTVRTTLQSFTKNFTYDSLGAVSQLDYPTCTATVPCGGLALTGPAFTHKNGLLTAVATYAPSISHNADGTVFEVTHDATRNIKDTYTPDASGMARPGVISFAGVSSCNASATVSGDQTIFSGQTAAIVVAFTGTAPWSITWSDGLSQNGITQNPLTRNVSPSTTTNYTVTSITDGASCTGTSNGSARVTVQACNASATVSGGGSITIGQSAQIQASLLGTAPWNITWSDGVQQTGINTNAWQRTVSPTATTIYRITSMTDATGCAGSSGSSTATINVAPLPAPASIQATTTANTLMVSMSWPYAPGGTWYQVERATSKPLNDWQPVGPHMTFESFVDSFAPSANPVTYLYRVRRGITIGGTDYVSDPSPLDYATIASNLFTDEPVDNGLTKAPIRGIHMGELRHAIDAVRYAAGYPPAWSSYAAATGPVFALDFTTARQKLDEAVTALVFHGVLYFGGAPEANGPIWAFQLQQMRDGVR
jgi:YD repeat-containing protein